MRWLTAVLLAVTVAANADVARADGPDATTACATTPAKLGPGRLAQATVQIANPSSAERAVEVTVVLRAGAESWRSKPITVSPGQRLERTYRPFGRDVSIDDCTFEREEREVVRPPSAEPSRIATDDPERRPASFEAVLRAALLRYADPTGTLASGGVGIQVLWPGARRPAHAFGADLTLLVTDDDTETVGSTLFLARFVAQQSTRQPGLGFAVLRAGLGLQVASSSGVVLSGGAAIHNRWVGAGADLIVTIGAARSVGGLVDLSFRGRAGIIGLLVGGAVGLLGYLAFLATFGASF